MLAYQVLPSLQPRPLHQDVVYYFMVKRQSFWNKTYGIPDCIFIGFTNFVLGCANALASNVPVMKSCELQTALQMFIFILCDC